MDFAKTHGLKFYEEYIDELLKYNIEPVVTLCHFDIPLALVDKYGSWRSRKVIDCYTHYCETVFRRFRDKVKYWITFNEINPKFQIGCMLAAGSVYPYSCNPEDVWESRKKDRENYFFIDVIGYYWYKELIKSFRKES